MQTVDAISFRRQILDWRDKWLEQIPKKLEKDLPLLLASLHERIDRMSVKETFASGKYAKKNLQPIYEAWIATKSAEIVAHAQSELSQINERILEHHPNITHNIVNDTSKGNITEATIATGTAGAAVLGIPVVAALSKVSAGYGLGIIGLTITSWPIVLTGATVLGGLAILGGKRIAGYREKAIRDLKEKTGAMISDAVFLQSDSQPSLSRELQLLIRATASANREEILSVQKHSV